MSNRRSKRDIQRSIFETRAENLVTFFYTNLNSNSNSNSNQSWLLCCSYLVQQLLFMVFSWLSRVSGPHVNLRQEQTYSDLHSSLSRIRFVAPSTINHSILLPLRSIFFFFVRRYLENELSDFYELGLNRCASIEIRTE